MMREAMLPHSNGAGRINSFALVTYIPDPLGSFLDRLRVELEPNTLSPKAHVTILPPRRLSDIGAMQEAWRWVKDCMEGAPVFRVAAGSIEIFPETNVIYLSIDAGFQHLRHLHNQLNACSLQFEERYNYHPHITLVQHLTESEASEVAATAAALWKAYKGPRDFFAEKITFVQETSEKRWVDLQQLQLSPVRVVRG
jgi:2'-5' RNA ligase